MQKEPSPQAIHYQDGDQLNKATPIDPYDDQPQIQPVDQETQNQLIASAKNYHKAYLQFKQKDFFSHSQLYIVSKRWLKRWKKFVSYEEVIQNKNPNKLLGCGNLPKINDDIVEQLPKNTLQYSFSKYDHYNIKLKDNLVEGTDFQFADEAMWSVLQEKVSCYPVKRYVQQGQDGKIVQIYYQKITLIPVCMDILKSIQQQRMTKLKEVYYYFSKYRTVEQFLQAGSKVLSDWMERQQRVQIGLKDYLKLWKMPQGTRKTILLNTFLQGCKANPSFTYKLFLDGQYIEDKSTKIVDLDIVKETVIVAQLRQYRQVWCFYNLKHKLKASCSYCKKQEQLNFVCSCKYAAYCSKQCKAYDKSHHKYRCPNEAESDQEEKQLQYNTNSKKGLVGLRNLGNTCFMNSGLQCLSHVKQLSQYFLKNQYLKDINKVNPLGTQGQLSTEFAKMIKNLWFGTQSTFSPHHLKKSIGKFQPMFSGYNQHDSGQLITYVLDGLNEDLNRIKVKPYIQTKDYDGRPDHIIAEQSWQIFFKRNQSIIVDLMYGQFKSIVECPTQSCKNISITFDPFSACTLPLIDNTKKKIQITYIKEFVYSKKFFLTYGMEKDYTLSQKLQQLKSMIGIQQDKRVMVYVSSYSSCDIINIKQQVNSIRKQYSYRSIYVRQLSPSEDIENDIKLMVANVVNNPYYSGQQYRKNIAPYQLFFVDKKLTNKQVYYKIINSYARILNQKTIDQATFEQKYIKQDKKDDIFRIIMIPPSRYYSCSYCGQKNCSGCKLPFNDDLFAQYIKYSSDTQYQRDKKYDIQLYWRKDEKQIQKIFDQIKEENDTNFSSPSSSKSLSAAGSTSIYDCLKQFQKEEVLGEDNAWYCPKCKQFVFAKKQMKIYKAPKILILCLKRFKRKQYFSEKISTLVDFPIEGLDLTDYISNVDLPCQSYQTKMEIQNQQKKCIYDLIGISNHFGSTGGGHYTAYCKDEESGQWYDFDDSSVSKMRTAADVVTESAYILFYKRRQ